MSTNPYFYRNIVVNSDDIPVSSLISDYNALNDFYLYGSPYQEPSLINEFDISFISFDLSSQNLNSFNLNMRNIGNVSSVNVTSKLIKNLQFNFLRDVSLSRISLVDTYNNLVTFSCYTTDGNNYYKIADTVNHVNIKTSDLSSNSIVFNFNNLINIPTRIIFDRYIIDKIFLIGDSYLLKDSILKEKIHENFDWFNAPWKDISINDNTYQNGFSISQLNDILYQVKNINGRRIFPENAIKITNYPYFNIHFRYHGYDITDVKETFDIIDSKSAIMSVNDTSYTIQLSQAIYLDISSSLFKYLNIDSNNIDLSINSLGEQALKLPLNSDISFDFIFSQYDNIDTEILYNHGSINSPYTFYNTINNLSDKLPDQNYDGNTVNYLNSDIGAKYDIKVNSIPLVLIGNKIFLSEIKNGLYLSSNDTFSKNIDSSNTIVDNININNYSNKIFDCSNLNVVNSHVSSVIIPTNSNNINIAITSCNLFDISTNKICVYNSIIDDISLDNLYINNKFEIYNNSFTNNLRNNVTYINFITYNNNDLINYDLQSDVISFWFENLSTVIDISGDLYVNSNTKGVSALQSGSNTRIVTPYIGQINTCDINNICITSDDNLKSNEKDISNAIHTINQINPKKYIKSDNSNNYWDSGYIAQDISNIIDLSYVVTNNDGRLTINYNAIQPYLVKAIQELNIILNSQSNEIIQLENKIKSLIN